MFEADHRAARAARLRMREICERKVQRVALCRLQVQCSCVLVFVLRSLDLSCVCVARFSIDVARVELKITILDRCAGTVQYMHMCDVRWSSQLFSRERSRERNINNRDTRIGRMPVLLYVTSFLCFDSCRVSAS